MSKKITIHCTAAVHARLVRRARNTGRSLSTQCLTDILCQVHFEDHACSTERAPLSQQARPIREGGHH